MPAMMAIVSKAVFEKDARGKRPGDLWPTDRYLSQNKALANLAPAGDLYLVTVRPPDEALWLVAVLARPTSDGTQWRAAANAHPIRDISALKRALRFANGQGLPAKPGALGMSLQTPRVLTADDVALLVAAAGGAPAGDDRDADGGGTRGRGGGARGDVGGGDARRDGDAPRKSARGHDTSDDDAGGEVKRGRGGRGGDARGDTARDDDASGEVKRGRGGGARSDVGGGDARRGGDAPRKSARGHDASDDDAGGMKRGRGGRGGGARSGDVGGEVKRGRGGRGGDARGDTARHDDASGEVKRGRGGRGGDARGDTARDDDASGSAKRGRGARGDDARGGGVRGDAANADDDAGAGVKRGRGGRGARGGDARGGGDASGEVKRGRGGGARGDAASDEVKRGRGGGARGDAARDDDVGGDVKRGRGARVGDARGGGARGGDARGREAGGGDGPGDGALARALVAMRAGRGEDALAQLVEAWADDAQPRIAELVTALSGLVRTQAPANLRGKTAAARAAWDEHAARARAADVPMLLESLCDVSSGDAAARLAAVAAWMPDPRIDAALVTTLRDVPYRATSTKPFWTQLFALLAELTDAAQLARIEAIDFEGVAATMAEWLRAKRAKLLATLQERMPPAGGSAPAETEAVLDDLAAAIRGERAAGAADRESVAQLFASVYEHPDDDGLRVVLADALIERGDPRGELINVQLRLAQDPDDRQLRVRERELLEAHGKGWLGELAPIVRASGMRFARGFLAACEVDNTQLDRVRRVVGSPLWATVEDFEGSALIALHPVMRSLRRLVFNQGNARRHEELPGAWRDLLVETPRPRLEALEYQSLHSERQWLDTVEGRRQVAVSDSSEVDALCACAALPNLRRLVIRAHPVLYIGKLAGAPVLERLAELGFRYDRNNRLAADRSSPLDELRRLLAEARVPRVRVEIGGYHETLLVLDRGERGYERAALTLGPTMRSNWSGQLVDEAIRMLEALPRPLRELHVTARRWTEPQQVARLRAAATQLGLERCEISGPA